MSMLSERLSLIGYVFLLGFGWALGIVLGRISLAEGFPVSSFAAIQAVGIFLAVAIISIFTRELKMVKMKEIYFFIGSGFFLVIIPYIVTYLSLSHIGASRMGVLLTTTPVFTALISIITKTESVNKTQLFGIFCGFVGVIILSISDSFYEQDSDNMWKWTIFAVLSPLSYALSNIFCFRLRPPELAPIPSAVGTNGVAALGLLVAMLTIRQDESFSILLTLSENAIYYMLLTVMANSVASIVFFIALPKLGAIGVSGAGYATAIIAGILGVTFLGENFGFLTLVSTVFVVIGVGFSSRLRD